MDQSSAPLARLGAAARDAKAWPFEQARALLQRLVRLRLPAPEAAEATALLQAGRAAEALERFEGLGRPVIFETGYGPSGLPHIGTFQEVARTTMVRTAFRALTDDAGPPTDLLQRRHGRPAQGPRQRPQPRAAARGPGKPLTVCATRSASTTASAAQQRALRAFLDEFGFDYEFHSGRGLLSRRPLRRGAAAHPGAVRRGAADHAAHAGPERSRTYSPFLPISPSTGRVLQVPRLERNTERGHHRLSTTRTGRAVETPVTRRGA
jgi:lysyl-tRNA synthetase class 1